MCPATHILATIDLHILALPSIAGTRGSTNVEVCQTSYVEKVNQRCANDIVLQLLDILLCTCPNCECEHIAGVQDDDPSHIL